MERTRAAIGGPSFPKEALLRRLEVMHTAADHLLLFWEFWKVSADIDEEKRVPTGAIISLRFSFFWIKRQTYTISCKKVTQMSVF